MINIINKSGFGLPKYETIGSAGMDLRAVLDRIYNDKYFNIDYKEEIGILIKNDNYKRTYKDGLWLEPHKQYLIPTGIFISLPKPIFNNDLAEGWGYEAQIRPRSGLSAKHGIGIANSIGTIDSDFRGEIMVILINLSNIPFKINNGDRIAQMVINRFEKISWNLVEKLDDTERGEGGFSSTGMN